MDNIEYVKLIDGVKYVVVNNKDEERCAVVVDGCNNLNGSVILQSHIDNIPVTRIRSFAFSKCNLKEVIIPNTITRIGSYAFEYSGIEQINIPESVLYIDAFAFTSCRNLKNVVFPNNIDTIGNCAFAGCDSLLSITFPAGMKNLVLSVVEGCENLKHIHFDGDSFEFKSGDNMGLGYNCPMLESITTNPSNVRYISIDGILYDAKKKTLIKVPSSCNISVYTLPKWVKGCESNALCDIRKIKTIKISQDCIYGFKSANLKIRHPSLRVLCVPNSKIEDYCKEFGIKTKLSMTKMNTFLSDLIDEKENLK